MRVGDLQGNRTLVRFQLELRRAQWVFTSVAVVFFAVFASIAIASPFPLAFYPGFFFLAFLLQRWVMAARFSTLLERSLEGLARPVARPPTS